MSPVTIALCPLIKFWPLIILCSPELCLECTADSLVCSLGTLIIRFDKQAIVEGTLLFRQLLDFLICFIKTVLVFPCRKIPQLQLWFPAVWSSSACTDLRVLQLSQNEVSPLT